MVPNSKHDIKDCLVIRGSKLAASISVDSPINSLAELATNRNDRRSPRIDQSQSIPWLQAAAGISISQYCSYCVKPGHNKRLGFIQHSDKAPAHFRAPTRALLHLFKENLARLQCKQPPWQLTEVWAAVVVVVAHAEASPGSIQGHLQTFAILLPATAASTSG